MIGIAHAVSYGINTLRYIKGESEKKRHPEKIYDSTLKSELNLN